MSRVNDVHSGMWCEDGFLDLSADAKFVYLWSFTNSDCPMSGLYRVARRTIAFQTGLAADAVVAALAELTAARFLTYVDGTMFVRTRVKHLRTKSEQIAKSIAADVRRFDAEHPARVAFMNEYGDSDWGAGRLKDQLYGEAPKEAPMEPQRESDEGPRPSMAKARAKAKEQGTTNDGRASGWERPTQPVKYGGKVQTSARLDIAEQILADFNERAGTAYKPYTASGKAAEPFKRVLGALTEHDDVDADMGRRINEAGLSDPWWGDGPAQPGNVWGPNVVDRNRQKALGLGRTRLRPVAHTADDFMAATARRIAREDQQTGDAA